jgi:hypothetical protein
MSDEHYTFLRIAEALERIALAQERVADADPLTMLDAVIGEHGVPGPAQEPLGSNGYVTVYQHPNPDYHIIARRNNDDPSGWIVDVQPERDLS